MSSYQNGLGNGAAGRPSNAMENTTKTSMGQAAQQAAAEGMQFQLWVSQQATSLNKLKIYNTMAKSINDQQ